LIPALRCGLDSEAKCQYPAFQTTYNLFSKMTDLATVVSLLDADLLTLSPGKMREDFSSPFIIAGFCLEN
jgi:hypothetical protein